MGSIIATPAEVRRCICGMRKCERVFYVSDKPKDLICCPYCGTIDVYVTGEVCWVIDYEVN
jgi:hypothetical protein